VSLYTVQGTANEITNPSWELGESSWVVADSSASVVGYYNRVSEFSWVGSYSAKVGCTTNTAAAGQRVWIETDYDIPVSAGDEWWGTVRVRANSTNLAPGIRVEFRTAGNVFVSGVETPVSGSDTTIKFHLKTLGMTVPATATKARVRLFVQFLAGSMANQHCWFDGAQFEKSGEWTTYCDGDQPSCVWQGAAHLSRSIRDAKQVPRGTVGRLGVIKIEPRLYIATRDNAFVNNITDWIMSGSVTLDTTRDIPMTFQAEIRHPDRIRPFIDYIAPELTVVYSDGTYQQNQVGLFVMLPPSKEYTFIDTVGTIDAMDMTWWLSKQSFDRTYTLKKGASYTDAMRSIVSGAGFTRYDIQTSGKTNGGDDKTWSPGTSKLQIFNDLADAINWYYLFADRAGVLRSFKFIDIHRAEPSGKYVSGENSVVIEPFSMSHDLERLANRVVVVKESTDAEAGTVIKAVRVNNNPASPTSIQALGGEITRVVTDGEVEDQEDANDLADKLMKEWGSVYINATMKTFPEPWHNPYEVYTLNLDRYNGQDIPEASGRYICKGWSIGFSPSEPEMTHQLFRIVEYGEAEV